jgi:hypothetical protein
MYPLRTVGGCAKIAYLSHKIDKLANFHDNTHYGHPNPLGVVTSTLKMEAVLSAARW